MSEYVNVGELLARLVCAHGKRACIPVAAKDRESSD
jgi:hypothetical protein